MQEIIDSKPSLSYEELRDIERKHDRKLLRSVAIIGGVAIVLELGLAAGLVAAHDETRRQEVIADVLHDTKPPYSERNAEVSSIAQAILNDSSIEVDCNSDATEKNDVAREDGLQTLAYVPVHTVWGGGRTDAVVPPYITMRGNLCNDLTTFTRMEPPEDADASYDSTYRIRGEQFAIAAAILMHEDEHINLVMNEAEATCYGMQKLPEAIESYYTTPDIALAYAQMAAIKLSERLAPEYISEECKPEGDYDLAISPVYTIDKATLGAIQ